MVHENFRFKNLVKGLFVILLVLGKDLSQMAIGSCSKYFYKNVFVGADFPFSGIIQSNDIVRYTAYGVGIIAVSLQAISIIQLNLKKGQK